VQAFQAEGTLRQNYVNILWMLLRLRQACNHPWLVRDSQHGYGRAPPLATGELAAAKRLPADTRAGLTSLLRDGITECVVCSDVPEDPVASVCGHIYCRQCVSSLVSMAGHGAAEAELAYHCPACGHTLGRHDTYGLGALEAAGKPGGKVGQGNGASGSARPEWQSSAKVDALLKVLGELRTKGTGAAAAPARAVARSVSGAKLAEALARSKGGSGRPAGQGSGGRVVASMEKVIVFSQWTSMLDLVETPLKQQGYEFRRLDGTMTIPARQAAIQDFSSCADVTVMLVSLKAASLGVNLVSANHVVVSSWA
jgi:SNF2 family DNA or RNA helicase